MSSGYYKLTRAKQETGGFCEAKQAQNMNKVHAEQVMAEEFQARHACGDRWLRPESREGLWRGQAQTVVKAMMSEAKLQNAQ